MFRAALLAMIVLGFAMAAAQPFMQQAPARSDASPGLVVENTYHGVNRAVMIRVTSAHSFGTVLLHLMDAQGAALAEPIEVHPGRLDLAERMPAIWTVRSAAFLQLVDRGKPVGSSLVIQPMLSRLVPITRVQPHPTTGLPHSRIVGWADENSPQMQAPPAANTGAPSPSNAESGVAATLPDDQRVTETNERREPEPPSIERLFSGLRIYPETDVLMRTSKGEIRIAMSPEHAPNTAWNFLELCRGGFYYDVGFHRVVKLTRAGDPFVIQAGDPTGTGDGGPGYWLPLEPSELPHDFGVISMARSDDPDSNGSQFFFCLSREGTARLDGQYCAFGYAVEGGKTILDIADVELANVATGLPADPPVITATNLIAAPPRVPGKGRPDQRVTAEQAAAQTQPERVPR